MQQQLNETVLDRTPSRGDVTLLSLDQSLDLDMRSANELYEAHLNRYLLRVFKILGFSEMDIQSAQGMEIRLGDGRTILDFSGGIGICGFGHNHPRLLEAERKFHERKYIDLIRVAPNKLQGALAHNIAQFMPDPLKVAFLTVSGSEAVEAAMKLCERVQGPKNKTKFLCMQGAFHGKTHGALAVTTAARFQRGFLLGVPAENVIYTPYGDIEAVEAAIRAETKDGHNPIIASIVEPIRGEAGEVAPDGFLTKMDEICRANDIMTIFDEVKTGMGRTGRFCAFQHEDVTPDVVTMAKALGGAKRAVGAMVTSQEMFDRAYGNVKDCSLHTSGFGGLGESCAVAIETLNILVDDGLIDRVSEMGEYFKGRLQELQSKHPKQIVEVRGKGLFLALRFNFNKSLAERFVDISTSDLFKTYQSVMVGSLIRELYEKHGILAHFQPGAVDVVHFMPSYYVEKEQIDRAIDAVDSILSRGLAEATVKFVGKNIARVLSRS